MKKTTSILFLFISMAAVSQDAVQWSKQLKKQIINQAKAEGGRLGIKSSSHIIVIPEYYYNCTADQLIAGKKEGEPVIDSFASYAVIIQKKEVKGIAENTGGGGFGFYSVADLKRLKRYNYADSTYRMILAARAYSANCFFIHFFPEERNRYWVIGFVVNGKTKFIDRNLVVYENVKECVLKRYHDLDRFKKRFASNRKKMIEQRKLTIEQAKWLTEEDYVQYGHHYPKDTIGVLARFVEDFILHAPFVDSKREDFQVAILDGLTKAPLLKSKKKEEQIPFLDRDVTLLVSPFVTAEQLTNYREYRVIKSGMIRRAYDIINMEEARQNDGPQNF
jgi:hypothetical protein